MKPTYCSQPNIKCICQYKSSIIDWSFNVVFASASPGEIGEAKEGELTIGFGAVRTCNPDAHNALLKLSYLISDHLLYLYSSFEIHPHVVLAPRHN